MALQNLFGDLALDSTTQTTNDLINQLIEVTNVLTQLINNQQQPHQPQVSATGALFVDLINSRSGGIANQQYIISNGIYDAQSAKIYADTNALYSNSIMAEAIAITSHLQVS